MAAILCITCAFHLVHCSDSCSDTWPVTLRVDMQHLRRTIVNCCVYVPCNFPTPEHLTVSSYSWSGRQLTADRCNKCSVIKSLDCNLSWRRNCAGCCCCAGTRGAGRRICWCWPPLIACPGHRSQLTLSQTQSRKQASSLIMHKNRGQ